MLITRVTPRLRTTTEPGFDFSDRIEFLTFIGTPFEYAGFNTRTWHGIPLSEWSATQRFAV